MRTALLALLAAVAPSLAAAQAVQILHEFDSPGPSLTVANGWLYGVTSAGGNGRGVVYRVSPDTGLITVTDSVPGPQALSVANSRLVPWVNGQLYGVTSSGPDAFIFRVDPGTGVAVLVFPAPSGLRTLTRSGDLFFGFLFRPDRVYLARFDPAAEVVTTFATVFNGDTSVGGPGELVAATDGRLYYPMVPDRTPQLRVPHLQRLTPATGAIEEIPLPQAPTGADYPDLRATPDGRVLVHVFMPPLFHGAATSRVDVFDIATATARTMCQFGYTAPGATPPAIDDTLMLVLSTVGSPQALLCDPRWGSPTTGLLMTEIGTAPRLTQAPDGFYYGTAPGGALGGGFVYRVAVSGQPPVIDTDGDGLDNTWESSYRLSAFRSTGQDGAAGDPDGDGRTNAEERAAGTHPRGTHRQYLAEGATGAFFSTRIAMLNPTAEPARVLTRFFTDTGAVMTRRTWLSPLLPEIIELGNVPGLEGANVSTLVEADQQVVVDRTMRWGADRYGSHEAAAVPAAATSWFLAEGSTSGDFALFYLLQNPQTTAVTATVRYLRPFGQPVVERLYVLPPTSRTTIAVDAGGPELANTDVSAAVTATAPIIVERAMYLTRGAQPFAAGHASAGVTAPALEWFLAEGATGPFFDLFLLIANPNPTPAAIAVDYLLLGGGVQSKTYTVAGNSRYTIWVDDEDLPAGSGLKPLANAALSCRVRSTNEVPVVVERTMWWPGPALTADYWYEAHNSPGATATALRWAFAGAEVGIPGLETYVLIANPSTEPGRARVTAHFLDRQSATRTYDLPPQSRTNVALGTDLQQTFMHGPFGVVVDSVGDSPVPIVVEHSTYSSPGNVTWASGGNALATPVP